jgi:transmembrane sensor
MKDFDKLNKIQSLSTDASFIKWVHSDFVDNNEFWSEFIDNNIDNSDEINWEIRIVRSLILSPETNIDTRKLWNRIEARIGNGNERASFHVTSFLSRRRWFVGLSAAATLILLFVFLRGMNHEVQKVEAPRGQDFTHNLPDGSEVLLDAGSEISYNRDAFSKIRDIHLTGHAFFEVKKGSSFHVLTKSGKVTVLGTSFSVLSKEGRFEVMCHTGSVRMELADKQAVILQPGKKCYEENGRILCLDEAETKESWMDGLYTFKSVPLGQVVTELENQYDIDVVLSGKASQMLYSGYFHQNNLNEALQSITWPLQLSYEIKEGTVYILD